MDEKGPQKVFVNIYCKVFTDSFSEEMMNRMATGQEICDFLVKDAGLCFDEKGNNLPGDCNLWYLGCNEKFGVLLYKELVSEWSFGESSFDRVQQFVNMVHRDGLFTEEQFNTLCEKIQEGRNIDNVFDIRDYLVAKREGKPWKKTEDAYCFRREMRDYVGRVNQHFRNEGWAIISNHMKPGGNNVL